MKQVFAASSWLQLVNISAALDSGLLDEAEERVLLVCDTRLVSEVGPSFAGQPEAAPLVARFDRVIDLNAWIRPMHPAQWSVKTTERAVWGRLLARAWELEGAEIQLFLESLQSSPAQPLAAVFADAELFVHSDGLMTYGPSRNRFSPLVWHRLSGLLHMDLVPGLTPLLLSEFPGVRRIPVPAEALREVIADVASRTAAEVSPAPPGSVLVIGQYLSDIGLLSVEEETAVYEDMVRRAAAEGASTVLFKAHPAASSAVGGVLEQRARAAGIGFELLPASLPVEVCAERMRPEAVYSCFSTGMVTAWRLYGTAARSFGTELALEAFAPYENSNRIPVTICRDLFGDPAGAGPAGAAPAEAGPAGGDAGGGAGTRAQSPYTLQELVDAVGYCMQSRILAVLRPRAEAFLTAHGAEASAYFKRRRLTKLDLPGGLPPRAGTLPQRARRAAGRGAREAVQTAAHALPPEVVEGFRPLAALAGRTGLRMRTSAGRVAAEAGGRVRSALARAAGGAPTTGAHARPAPAGAPTGPGAAGEGQEAR
ncbi:polysialyltransferase family glycosyltransferase [Brevibacterium album]|uniref:polysialyltransferase family glycosyltransferase n=1 Tax=Brevibacterium album TaxID=417948 RepID=UPI000403F47C|nr:polysialyltransferase family glycosyltransferase [Brevibacterium album]